MPSEYRGDTRAGGTLARYSRRLDLIERRRLRDYALRFSVELSAETCQLLHINCRRDRKKKIDVFWFALVGADRADERDPLDTRDPCDLLAKIQRG